MALNITKTKSIVVTTKMKWTPLQDQRIKIVHNGTMIKAVDCPRPLGLAVAQLTKN